jgi:DnaJ-class molecular chaperone
MNFFEKAQARAHALDILGLTCHPSQDEIRSAFKRLAFETHPDRTDGVEDEFIQVQSAYTLLKDDRGYMESDRLRPTPTDTAATTFHASTNGGSGHVAAKEEDQDVLRSFISPRRVRAGMTSRIVKINQSEASECRSLLDEIPHMAEPDKDEISLRASILTGR